MISRNSVFCMQNAQPMKVFVALQFYGSLILHFFIAFDEGKHLIQFESRGTRCVLVAIRFHGFAPSSTGWHILPRSHVFSFPCSGTGIYFVTLHNNNNNNKNSL